MFLANPPQDIILLHLPSSKDFGAAADNERIDQLELIWIPRSDPSSPALPPGRDHTISCCAAQRYRCSDERTSYTRGSVPLYKSYAGMYVPSVLPFRVARAESSPTEIATQLLMLIKMNWNATQLDGRVPITFGRPIRSAAS